MACAQHIYKETLNEYWRELYPVHVLFLLQLNHIHGEGFKVLSGSQTSWKCIHIDELREPSEKLPSLIRYLGRPISSLFDLVPNSVDYYAHSFEAKLPRRQAEENFMYTKPAREGNLNLRDRDDPESALNQADVEEMLPIIKGCIQAAMREVSDRKNMKIEEVGIKIKILFGLLQKDQGKS